ncbi:MAG: prepilin peptidase [Alphaproteobacteria bacterium]|nr:prepilin peptidase [Alphaproteobacteria bacterium]
MALIGLSLGSFASAVVARLPEERSLLVSGNGAWARSSCPLCGHHLAILDLIPLVSWLWGRGRCRYCGGQIGVRYLLIELLALCGAVGAYVFWGFTPAAFLLIAAIPLLLALLFVDLDHMVLPDILILLLSALALCFICLSGLEAGGGLAILAVLLGAAVSGLIYGGLLWLVGAVMRSLLKKPALGFGDVKFFAMAGLWIGLPSLPFFMVLSGVIGLLWGVVWRFIRRADRFPFGPALILALYFLLLLNGPRHPEISGLFSFFALS